MSDPSSADPQAAFIARVRRLMVLAVGGTFVALAVVLGLIGYRLFRSAERPAPAAVATPVAAPTPAATLPAGAKVLATAVGDGRIVLTVEVDGAVELRTFDLKTLKPLGRLRLAPKP